MSKLSKLVVTLSKEQSANIIIGYLNSFKWLNGIIYTVEVKKSDFDIQSYIEENTFNKGNFLYSNWKSIRYYD